MINIFKIGYSIFFKFPLVFLSSSFLASLQIFQIQYPLPTLQKEYQGKIPNFAYLQRTKVAKFAQTAATARDI